MVTSETSIRAGVASAFDRIGARAWAVAIWIVEDENVASAILVAAFARAGYEARSGPQHDASLLCEVRRQAIAAVAAQGPERTPAQSTVDAASTRVRGAITRLPEPQRGMLELALFGRLTVPVIAATLGLRPADVASSISGVMRTLRGEHASSASS